MEAVMLTLARLDQLYPQLLSRLAGGCPEGHLLAALQRASVRFFREAMCWRQDLPAVDGVADQKAYTLDNPWRAEIMRILYVGVRTADEITEDADDKGTEVDQTEYEFFPQTNKIKFDNAPFAEAVTDGLLVNALLVPTPFSSELPEWLMSRYHEGIVAGAAQDILSQPGTERYNPDAAKVEGNTFKTLVSTAFVDADTDYTSKPFQFGRRYDVL
jgi:hypothetical protein